MFLGSFIHIVDISIIIIISYILKHVITDKTYLEQLDEKIKSKKYITKSNIQEQNEYLDLLDLKNNHLGRFKFIMFGILIYIVGLSIYLKQGQTFYIFGIKIGFWFSIIYAILFSIIFDKIIKRFINN